MNLYMYCAKVVRMINARIECDENKILFPLSSS